MWTVILDKEQWNDLAIKERTKWLSKYILDNVFPIPESMRKTNNYKTKDKVGLSFLDLQLIGEEAGICWGATTTDLDKNIARGENCLASGHMGTAEYPQIYLILDGYYESKEVVRCQQS